MKLPFLHKKQPAPTPVPITHLLSRDKISSLFGYLAELEAIAQDAKEHNFACDWEIMLESLDMWREYLANRPK